MRRLVLYIVAAATLAAAAPAYAQVEFRAGEGGVGFRFGDGYRDHNRAWRRDRDYVVRDRDYRGGYARGPGCRDVTVRKTLPSGDRVVRRSRSC